MQHQIQLENVQIANCRFTKELAVDHWMRYSVQQKLLSHFSSAQFMTRMHYLAAPLGALYMLKNHWHVV